MLRMTFQRVVNITLSTSILVSGIYFYKQYQNRDRIEIISLNEFWVYENGKPVVVRPPDSRWIETTKGADILPGKPLSLPQAGSEFIERVKILKWYKAVDRYCVKYHFNENDKPEWSIWSAELFNAIKEKNPVD